MKISGVNWVNHQNEGFTIENHRTSGYLLAWVVEGNTGKKPETP